MKQNSSKSNTKKQTKKTIHPKLFATILIDTHSRHGFASLPWETAPFKKTQTGYQKNY